ncbi:MAG: type IV secretion system protein [Alphaproteobacteria bacterium]|nr:type IV secretion system protein [Alphaproteobacteria bacterium]
MAEETDFGVYTFLYKNINDSIINTVFSQILRISGIIQAPLSVAMTLYIVLYGWMILRGDVDEPMTAFLKRCLKLAIIWYVLIKPLFFWQIFGKVMLHTLPNDIITAITGKLAGNPVDAYASHGFQAAGNMWRAAEWYEIGTILFAGIVVISTALSSVAAFFIFAMSDMATAMLLILAPFFICLLLYERTNRWFEGWLSALVTFVLLKILLISLLSLVHKILEDMMKLSDGWETMVLGVNVLIVYFVGFFIFLKLYDIAASIGGGPVMSGMGATANAGIKAYKRFQERRKVGQQEKQSNQSSSGSYAYAGSSGSAPAAPSSSTGSAGTNKAANTGKSGGSSAPSTSSEGPPSYTAPISSARSVPGAWRTSSFSLSFEEPVGELGGYSGSAGLTGGASKPRNSTRTRRLLTPSATPAGSAATSSTPGNPGAYGGTASPGSTGSSNPTGEASKSSGSTQSTSPSGSSNSSKSSETSGSSGSSGSSGLSSGSSGSST